MQRRHAWLVFGLYVVLAVGMTWPVAARLGSHIPGSEGDAWVHLWTFRWVRDALLAGESPFYTHRLFFPAGVSLLFHNIAWVHIGAWLPLQAIFGEAAAYSLVFLLIFIVNGWGTFLLARTVTQSPTAAFIAGLIAAFWPYTLSHHNHPNLIFFGFVPLGMVWLGKLGGKWREAVVAGVLLGLVGLSRWQVLIMAMPLLGLWVIRVLTMGFWHTKQEMWHAKAQRRKVSFLRAFAPLREILQWQFIRIGFEGMGRRVAWLLLCGVVAVAVMLPLAWPVVAGQLGRADSEELFVEEPLEQTDLLAYVLPSRYQPLWGEAAFKLYDGLGVNRTFVAFVGYTTLLLALLGAVGRWRQSWFWLLSTAVYLLLALGPTLLVNGRSLIPLPTALIQEFFLLRLVRSPDRFNVLLALPVAMLAAWGVVALERREWGVGRRAYTPHSTPHSPRSSLLTTAVLSLLILSETIVTYPTFALDVPRWYGQLAQESGEFGIVDIPMHDRSYDKEYMFQQSVHGKGLVEGHVSRPPTAAFATIEAIPLLAELRQNKDALPSQTAVSHQLALLHQANLRYIVLHDKFLTAEQEQVWRRWLHVPPVYEDDELVVYATEPPQLGRDFALAQVLTRRNGQPEIGLVAAEIISPPPVPGGLVEIVAHWGSKTAVSTDYSLCLTVAAAAAPVLEQCQPLAPDWPTANWQPNELVQTRHTFTVDPFWPSGDYTVMASLGGEETAVLATFTLAAPERRFDLPPLANPTNFAWDDQITLRGYDLAQSEAALTLMLHWQALRRPAKSYKLFVHLLDPNNQAVVAQADFVPRNWSYPTNWWEVGEVVADEVGLDLTAVSPGSYDLLVGIYDPDTGQRLPLTPPAANDAALLSQITR